MEKIKFTIVTLPEKQTLDILNHLRNYFYTSNFRYKNKPNNSDAHVSLAQGICTERDINNIKENLEEVLKQYKPLTATYSQVTNEVRGPIQGKCDFNNAWVSILFDSDELRSISQDIDTVLRDKKMSTTNDYINRIKEGIYKGNDSKVQVIANHMNICNYCRPEKAPEAQDTIISKISKEIVFDRIAFRYNSGQHAWEIEL